MSDRPGLIMLKPVFHNNIWGGRRLEEFGYELPDGPVGECWGIAAHPHGDCTVDGGPYDGMTLSQLWYDHHELFEGATGDRFPLLLCSAVKNVCQAAAIEESRRADIGDARRDLRDERL